MTTPQGADRKVQVNVVGQIDDNLQRELDRFNRTLGRTEDTAGRVTDEADDLGRELRQLDRRLDDVGDDTGRTISRMDRLRGLMRNVGGPASRVAVGGLASVAAGVGVLGVGFARANERFQEYNRLSQETGVSLEELQRLSAGAAAAGLEVEQSIDRASAAVREYNLRLGEYQSLQSGQFVELAELGIDPETVSEFASTSERYIAILETIRQVSRERGEATAAVVADLLVGGAEAEEALALATASSERFRAYTQNVRDARVISDESQRRFREANIAFNQLQQSMDTLITEATSPLAEELGNVAERARPFVDELTDFAANSEGLEQVSQEIGNLLDGLLEFAQEEDTLATIELGLRGLARGLSLLDDALRLSQIGLLIRGATQLGGFISQESEDFNQQQVDAAVARIAAGRPLLPGQESIVRDRVANTPDITVNVQVGNSQVATVFGADVESSITRTDY